MYIHLSLSLYIYIYMYMCSSSSSSSSSSIIISIIPEQIREYMASPHAKSPETKLRISESRLFGGSNSSGGRPPLEIKNLLESSPLKSRFLVCGLAVRWRRLLERTGTMVFTFWIGISRFSNRHVRHGRQAGVQEPEAHVCFSSLDASETSHLSWGRRDPPNSKL